MYNKKYMPDVAYKEIILRYRSNLDLLKNDYESLKRNNIDFFSVDFSELFSYAYPRSSSSGSRLIDDNFDSNLSRDFKLTLLPPAIFELRRHYDYLVKIGIYKYKKGPAAFSEYDKLIKQMESLPDKERYSPDDVNYKNLLNTWESLATKISNFDILVAKGTRSGHHVMDKSHKRLMSLFESGAITNLNQIEAFSDHVHEIRSNQSIFNKYLKIFNEKRSAHINKLDNMVDAEHAAIIHEINKKILTDSSMYIYTGSPIALRIYERELTLEKGANIRNFARDPMYLRIRLFLNNELNAIMIDRTKFLNEGLNLFNLLASASSPESIQEEILKNLKMIDDSVRPNFLSNKLSNFIIFNSIAMPNLNLFFREGIGNENAGFSQVDKNHEYTYPPMKINLLSDLNDSGKVNDIREALLDPEIFKSNFENCQSKLENNLKEIFKTYYRLLEGYDLSKLSTMMQIYYKHISEDPDVNH